MTALSVNLLQFLDSLNLLVPSNMMIRSSPACGSLKTMKQNILYLDESKDQT